MLTVEDFKIKELPPELSGLTKKILWDIYDILTKFGILDAKNQLVDFRHKLANGEAVGITAPIEEKPRFMIGKSPVFEGGTLLVVLQNGNVIFWEQQLSLETVKLLIAEVDALAWENNLIDKRTGERLKSISLKKGPVRYKVSEVFKDRGVSIPILPGGPSAEEIMATFDEPDKLMVFEEEPLLGLKGICLKDDREYLKRRRQVALELLKEKGLSILDVAEISIAQIMELREEIGKRLKSMEEGAK